MNDNITFLHARIGKRNFEGKELRFNPKGQRNFWVFLEPEDAEKLTNLGYNVKVLEPRDPDSNPQAFLKVSVSFSNYPPKMVLISGKERVHLDESTCKRLDWAEIKNVDLTIRPYSWEVNGKTGTKAFLKSIYVTAEEDELDSLYYVEEMEE